MSVKEAVAKASHKNEDPRIVDVQIYSGAKEKPEFMRFRRAMAIRSISLEYMQFQQDQIGFSRVDLQAIELSSAADQTQQGTIDQFIAFNRSRADIFSRRIKDAQVAKMMIKDGTKMLVLERLYGHCGITAVLWLIPSWTKLRYPDLPTFLELLCQNPEYHRIHATAEDLVDWYDECQTLYDENTAVQQLASPRVTSQPIRLQQATTRIVKYQKNSTGKVANNRKSRSSTRPFQQSKHSFHKTRQTGPAVLPPIKEKAQRDTNSSVQQHRTNIGAPNFIMDSGLGPPSAGSRASPVTETQQITGKPDVFDAGMNSYSFIPETLTNGHAANNMIPTNYSDVFDAGLNAYSFSPGTLTNAFVANNPVTPTGEPDVFDAGLNAYSFSPGTLANAFVANNPVPTIGEPDVFDAGMSAYSFHPRASNFTSTEGSSNLTGKGQDVLVSGQIATPFFPEGSISEVVASGHLRTSREPEAPETGQHAFSFCPGSVGNMPHSWHAWGEERFRA
ncbi:hypothetical protein ABOM_012195 [Aspergillus bombycis]|uniref:Uncharacterized protein n=1 Tax=Aspergillus bombycis TaxID=109264 RepID=A0A1F7ZJL9_9EURO|nr:hypothetical protein ABOM_012195 [Aspergillus bombycis]OGM39215.1 hypothetical protein ABOM_012195 [Aspergillus bombycis]